MVAARLASACITVAIPLVLARALDLAEYGTYKQLFLISQTLYYVLPFGVAQSLYFFAPRVGERRPYFGQTLVFLAFAGAAAGALLFGLGPRIASALNNPALAEHRLELALFCALAVGAFPLELSMTSQGKTRESALTYLVSDLLRAAALVVPVLLGAGLHGMMAAVVAWAALRLAAAWVLMLGRSKGRLFDRRLFVSQLAYAAPFGAAVLLSVPQQYAHQFVVSSEVGPALFAIYAAGCFQLPLVDLLYTPTSEVLMVRLGELDAEGRAAEGVLAFREAASKLAYVFLPLAAFLFAAAPELIAAFFGPRFLAAVPIFRVVVCCIPLAVLPLDGTLRARNETRHIFVSYLVKAAVTGPLVWFGVKAFGMMGGIGSWAIAEVVGKGFLLARVPSALSTKQHPLGLGGMMPWASFGKAGAAALAAGAPVFVARWAWPDAWASLPASFGLRLLPLALAGLAFSVGYLLALRLVGVRVAGSLSLVLSRRASRA
ncbi:MAG: oligosaccharide flippase family protein [Myxococcales bacterium]|nr:oligosaccharide flippase family protein [Myxococcales bacterium]